MLMQTHHLNHRNIQYERSHTHMQTLFLYWLCVLLYAQGIYCLVLCVLFIRNIPTQQTYICRISLFEMALAFNWQICITEIA